VVGLVVCGVCWAGVRLLSELLGSDEVLLGDGSLGAGVAAVGVGCDSLEGSLESGSACFDSDGSTDFSPPAGALPGSMRARSWPTVTVSPSLTRSSLMIPDSGALAETFDYQTRI